MWSSDGATQSLILMNHDVELRKSGGDIRQEQRAYEIRARALASQSPREATSDIRAGMFGKTGSSIFLTFVPSTRLWELTI